MGGLWCDWPYKMVAFGESDLIRGVAFGETGLIIGVAFDESDLIIGWPLVGLAS